MLNRSVVEGEAKAYIEALMEELICCTVWHFRHEERLMLKYGYEGLEEHKSEHKELGFFRDCARKKRFSFGEQRTARCRGCSAKYGAMLDL